MNPLVDNYLSVGCGRCPLFNTPQCKVHTWQTELVRLRKILLATELTEDVKWSMPCYTVNKRNVVILCAFKEYVALNFFQGVLLKDPERILVAAGENSQSARQLRFVSVREITQLKPTIQAYLAEAIALEKAGLKVKLKPPTELKLPPELLHEFAELPALRTAFNSLTPGRQRAYVLFFSAAKQSATRTARIEKCTPQILAGQGLHDR